MPKGPYAELLTDSNARSTKTRIETQMVRNFQMCMGQIRMQDPLKQGLKLCFSLSLITSLYIRMQDPLKQGLKPAPAAAPPATINIRMQDPLKQGLKLTQNSSILHLCIKNSNARSTKTRIETYVNYPTMNLERHSNARSTKTRIETIFSPNPPRQLKHIRMQDPLKQGLKPKTSRTAYRRISIFECKIH